MPRTTDLVRRFVLPLSCLALIVGAGVSPAAQEPAPFITDAKALEQQIVDAVAKHDAIELDRLLAPDFVLRGAPDVLRAAWLRNTLAGCWGNRFDINDFAARYEDRLIVTSFVLTFYMNPETCRPAKLRTLITDVWRPGPTDWQLTMRHSGPVPSATAVIAGQYGVLPEAPPAWAIDGELSLVATAGNSSTRTLGAGIDTQHRSNKSTTRFTVNFITTEAQDVTQAESLTAQARHGVRIGPHAQLFARAAYARDRFAGISNRTTVDAGSSYTANLTTRQTLTVEAGVGFVNEQRQDRTTLQFASANGTGTFVWKFNGSGELHEDATVTADLEQGRNWRTTSATSVLIALNRILSLKVSHAIEYRHAPVPGFGRTDMKTAAAVVVTLRRRRLPP